MGKQPRNGDKERIRTLPIPQVKALEGLMREFKSGKVRHAIVVYEKEGEPMYSPLTSSEFCKLGWLLFTAMQALSVEEAGVDME